ncbi:MAG TPA: PilN domain-containing protein [Rhodanobacter sp.]|nr:PilN domain-containing protein [Rhodanobacter sp.]
MSTAKQPLQPWMDRLRRSWRASPLPVFLGWWGGELRQWMPRSWRGWFGTGADWYLLEEAGEQWTVRHRGRADVLASWSEDRDQAQALALNAALKQVDREDLRLALLLPSSTVLRRTLVLPLAARDNLLQVVGFEMDRQTPFNLAQVYYAARELPAPAATGRIQVELVAVLRDTLDPLLARLRAQGITIDAVDMALGDDCLGVNLLPAEQAPRRTHPRRRLNLALAAACVLLLLLVCGEWLHNRQLALEQMQAEVEGMRGEAQQVASLRQQLQDNAGAAGFLAQRKMRTVSMLSLLLDVTARLPDSTWLERFSVDNTGQIGLQGQSRQSAKLLDVLKDSRVITDAGFQGSIQPDPATGKERFYLTARLRQPASAPTPSGSSRQAGSP